MDVAARNKGPETTGISRAGRVCKKSSLLADFESPDDIDRRYRYKRRKDRPPKVVTPKPVSEDTDFYLDREVIDVKDEPLEVDEWGVEDAGVLEGAHTLGEGNLLEFSDPLQVDEASADVAGETYSYPQAQLLYFSEEQSQQSFVTKARPPTVKKKARRKDKGKPRVTAYMLWAREVRSEILQENPDMSFTDVNKRLGELWAQVPTSQKYNWKRRARRLAIKGVQKEPTSRANRTKKVGMEPAPRPDPNPAPPPPSLASQGSGHRQQPGIKRKQSKRKRPQAQEPSTATAPTSAAAVKRKRVDQGLPRELYTITYKSRLCESLSQSAEPPNVPVRGRKHAREDKALDQKQEQWQLVVGGGETEVSEETNTVKEGQSLEQQHEGSMVTDCAVASPGDDAMTDPAVVVHGIIRRKPCTVSDIFFNLCAGRLSSFCPVSLARALASVMLKRLTLMKASTLFCVSPSRLQKCFTHLNSLRHGKWRQHEQLLREMRLYPVHEAVREWLLRMQRMGRSPVRADVMQVFRFTGRIQKITGQLEGILSMYSRHKMSHEEWAVLSPAAATNWHSVFQDHVYVRCGTSPYELLTLKNSPQVFTSAEVLVGLGDLPHEVIVARGKSNLYCLTQQEQGVARAVLTFSAAGQFHSPVIIQKGYSIPHWALKEDSVDLLACPDGRWDPLLFLSWLRLFERRLTQAAVPRPVVLFVHGHPSHASPAADAFCTTKGIILHSHHHSPINPMDPFIHLLPPLLHHLACTQEQLTALTGVYPLPDRLLPTILADAWTQVSEENLAGKAFQKSCLVPFTEPKLFPLEKYTKISRFPPLLLKPARTYFAVGDSPAEVPYIPEPQLVKAYQLHVEELRHKLSVVDKVIVSQEEPTITEQVDEDEMIVEHSNETYEAPCIAPEPAGCEANCKIPEPACDPSVAESAEAVLMQNEGMLKIGSPADNSSDKSPEPLEELPLKCELQEEFTSPKSSPRSPDEHSGWEDEDASDSSSQACDPLYVGPDPLCDPSVMESERVIHIHNNLMACLSSSTDCSSEKPPEEELHSSAACEVQESNSQNIRKEYVAYEPILRGTLESRSPSDQHHSKENPEPECDFNLVLLKDEAENEEVT